jgi:DNA-binding transcriptional LysR family regulator
MQWDDIRFFLALARQGSLSGAARQLKVEHSTVARRVDALEQSLGIRLFDRLPKAWSLTPEGETLVEHAGRLDDEAQSFARAALGASSIRGTVRVSAPPNLASHVLAPRLAAQRGRWQNIDLELVGEIHSAQLSRGEADLALRMSQPSAPGLVARRVGTIRYALYAAHGYTRHPASDWTFLGYDDSLRQVAQQQWLERVAAGRRQPLRSNDLTTLLHATRAGMGVAALPCYLAAGDSSLSPVVSALAPPVRELWLVMHPDVRRSPRVRLMADLLVSTLESALDACEATHP